MCWGVNGLRRGYLYKVPALSGLGRRCSEGRARGVRSWGGGGKGYCEGGC